MPDRRAIVNDPTALAIRLRDGPPVLFRQARAGHNGRPFTMVKFRTMVPDATAHLAEVWHLNQRNGIVFKAADDPRVTRLGRRLRDPWLLTRTVPALLRRTGR